MSAGLAGQYVARLRAGQFTPADVLAVLQGEPCPHNVVMPFFEGLAVNQPETRDVSAFEASIVYRLAVELARTWVIAHWLAKHKLPEDGTLWAYPSGGEAVLDWGDDPREPDAFRPMKGKRVQIVLSVEDIPDPTARDRGVPA